MKLTPDIIVAAGLVVALVLSIVLSVVAAVWIMRSRLIK